MTPLIGTSILMLEAVTGGWLDLTSRRLPNWLCLVTLITGLGFVVAELGLASAAWALAHSAIALLVGMVLFRIEAIGAGDAKFYAACAAWFPLQEGLTLLASVSLSGLLLVIGWFGYRQFRRVRDDAEKGKFGMVPYGLAVAAGAGIARMMA